MKKLIVLVSALLLVSMVVAASDVTVGGKVSYRWMQDIGNMEFYEQAAKERVEVKINATVDDYNTVAVVLREMEAGDAGASVHRANFTTDMGALFDLPVGVTLKTGFDEYKASPDKSFVTWGEYEDVLGTETKAWGQKIEIAAHEYVNLVAFWAYSTDFDMNNFGVGANGSVSMVTYEVALLGAGKEEIGEGNLEFGLSAAQDVADGINVAGSVGFDYLLDADAYSKSGDYLPALVTAMADDDAWVPGQWKLGVGVELTYNEMASLGIGYQTMAANDYLEIDGAGAMQVDMWAQPLGDQPFEVLASVGLMLDDEINDSDVDTELLNSVEFSLKYKFGAAEFYLGYLWVNKNTVALFAGGADDGEDKYHYYQVAKEKAADKLKAGAIDALTAAVGDDFNDSAGAVFMRMELAY